MYPFNIYNGPEILQAVNCDARSNIWSLGVMAIELLQSKFPFQSINKGRYYLYHEILEYPPPKPPENTSPEFQSFLMKCLTKDYKERATAEELLNDPFIASVSEKDGDQIIYNLIKEFEAFTEDEEEEGNEKE